MSNKVNSLDEYKNWIADIKSNKRDDKADFVYSLMKSPYIEYHYSLLKDETLDDEFVIHLGSRFDEHGEKGANFLLDKLHKNIDIEFHGNIIFMLGQLSEYNKKETLKYAKELTNSKSDFTREQAYIVLNWVGGLRELSILRNGLLHDKNTKCRAWSASAFMQMWFHKKRTKLREFALTTYREALETEKDYFVLSTIIESVQEIEDKKFGISQKNLDLLNEAEIDKAKRSVIRYIEKTICY